MENYNSTEKEKELEIYLKMRKSFRFYIRQVWGLTTQPLKEEYKEKFIKGLSSRGKDWDRFTATVTPDWFQPFVKGKHISWQQSLVVFGIDKAVKGEVPLRISVVSGHGTGKSMLSSLLLLWFLFAHADCQIACTSPGQQQMYDVLWKEIKKWIEKMPQGMQDLYIWESSHIRMKESPNVWFARAKTASKENTEALAGVHADWVLILVDEASGVEEAIYETMEGALTSGNVLVFLVSNGTRATGYFYDTHNKDKERWQNYKLSSLDSPMVDLKYNKDIEDKYGLDSVQYAIRVKGEFPKEDGMDDSGYVPLLSESQIRMSPNFGKSLSFSKNSILGVDPSGDGDDKTSFVIRDNFKAQKIYEENKSTAKSIAEKIMTFIEHYGLKPHNVIVDAFGCGMDVGKEVALASKGRYNITTVNTGDKCEYDTDKEQYFNKRAMGFYESRKWILQGGEIVYNENFKEEILQIKYKRNLAGLIQIMPKTEMKKKGMRSPNDADAFSMTFLKKIPKHSDAYLDFAEEREGEEFDPHAVIQSLF